MKYLFLCNLKLENSVQHFEILDFKMVAFHKTLGLLDMLNLLNFWQCWISLKAQFKIHLQGSVQAKQEF